MITVSIIGVGSRGGFTYGTIMNAASGKYKIVSLCDALPEKLNKFGTLFQVEEENRFTDEDSFFQKRRSRLLVISTLDQDHVRQAKKAIQLGYDILLEKPISPSPAECLELLKMAEEKHSFVMVCHVLRYTFAVEKIKALLDAKRIGELVMIDHLEQVGYAHDAHSYVRGNWRKSTETAPMILAKSCHDMDLLQYFAESPCETISSVGDLRHFKKANQPKGASDRCLSCIYQDSCPYSAKLIYLEGFKNSKNPQDWPYNVLTTEFITLNVLRKALEEGPYGRCVFASDNDVVDHQCVMMRFKNGIKATFRMTAFTKYGGRQSTFYGTEGEIDLDETKDEIRIRPFLGADEIIKISDLGSIGSGHGGGDERMIERLYEKLTDSSIELDTSLSQSMESHWMAFAAEESRIHNGELIQIKNIH